MKCMPVMSFTGTEDSRVSRTIFAGSTFFTAPSDFLGEVSESAISSMMDESFKSPSSPSGRSFLPLKKNLIPFWLEGLWLAVSMAAPMQPLRIWYCGTAGVGTTPR